MFEQIFTNHKQVSVVSGTDLSSPASSFQEEKLRCTAVTSIARSGMFRGIVMNWSVPSIWKSMRQLGKFLPWRFLSASSSSSRLPSTGSWLDSKRACVFAVSHIFIRLGSLVAILESSGIKLLICTALSRPPGKSSGVLTPERRSLT